MNARKFKRAKARDGASLRRGYVIPKESRVALILWAFNERPERFKLAAMGISVELVRRALEGFEENLDMAIVMAAMAFGCQFDTHEVEAARAVVRRALDNELEMTILS